MESKDWVGNSKVVYSTLGASNHVPEDRAENDYYATDPIAIDILCSVETFKGTIWENSCGSGHLSKKLIEKGYQVISTDLINRGYGTNGVDFLKCTQRLGDNIVMNPPYKYATEFVEKSIDLVDTGYKVCAFLKLQFIEGKERKGLFLRYPPKTIYASSSRILCAKNGEFLKGGKKESSAVAYCWYIWVKGYNGDTVLKWVN